MPNRFIKTCRKELDLYNCGFDHDYADSMVRSQWQARSRNNMYLLYRWLVAIFVLIIVLYSFVDNAIKRDIGTFFIYFTHWGIMINMVVGVMGAILVTVWHFHDDFKGNFFDFFADEYKAAYFSVGKKSFPSSRCLPSFNIHFISFTESVLSQNYEMPTVFRVYWALHNTALVSSVLITIIYWAFLFGREYSSPNIGIGSAVPN